MPKFRGEVGVMSVVEDSPGNYVEVVTPHILYGELIRIAHNVASADSHVSEITPGYSVSIMPTREVIDNWYGIRYVVYRGVYWTVTSVTFDGPRLTLRLGGVYTGEKPTGST